MPVKKAATKAKPKAPAKKAGKKEAPVRKITAVRKPTTKVGIIEEIAGNTDLTKNQVVSVFDELAIVIERHIKKRGPGKFSFPGLLAIDAKKRPATKARKSFNPFTREEMMFKAKPARKVLKIRPLKKLKDMVA